MEEDLRTFFDDYVELAQQNLRQLVQPERFDDQLRQSVEHLERNSAFVALVKQTATSFQRSDSGLRISGLWEGQVGAFFRLSGTYAAFAAGDALPGDDLFSRYCSAFQAERQTRTILVPLEFVEFSKDSMGFKTFMLRRFSSEELDDIFQNRMRRVFYPYAVVDTDALGEYWCLTVHESVANLANLLFGSWDEIVWDSRVQVSYSEHPATVQTALRHLALFNWGSSPFEPAPADARPIRRKEWEGPFLPQVPFVLSATDSLIMSPTRAPDLSKLATEPVLDQESGEHIGDQRAPGLHMDEEQTARFEEFMKRVVDLTEVIEPCRSKWTFIDTALGFLLKAFTTDGLEQLLWHITAIEAVLGQKVDAGLTKLLLSRVSTILGRTEEERRDFKKRFDKLYSFRSDLIHGNANLAEREIYRGYLGEARDYARCIVLWMLHYLAQAASAIPAGEPAPTRDQLLALLDLDAEGCENC